MNKYIDAEKLKAEIERRKVILDKYKDSFETAACCKQELKWIEDFISSLQQEQPEVDLVAELKHHLVTTPKEQLEKEWKELEPWDNIGPTVQEFLYGKQPKVDLEKEIIRYQREDMDRDTTVRDVACHFYKLGLNARKED